MIFHTIAWTAHTLPCYMRMCKLSRSATVTFTHFQSESVQAMSSEDRISCFEYNLEPQPQSSTSVVYSNKKNCETGHQHAHRRTSSFTVVRSIWGRSLSELTDHDALFPIPFRWLAQAGRETERVYDGTENWIRTWAGSIVGKDSAHRSIRFEAKRNTKLRSASRESTEAVARKVLRTWDDLLRVRNLKERRSVQLLR